METEVKDMSKVQTNSHRKNHKLFSKALFKQSCKANGMMWLIITIAVCFTLACVMIISGTSNISSVKENIESTIIEEAINSSVRKGSITTYSTAVDGEYLFDHTFAETFDSLNTPENYQKIAAITDAATSAATDLVTTRVTEKVTAEVTSRMTGMVQARVSEMVSDEVTCRLSAEVQTRVGEMVSAEVTYRIQAEVAAYVQGEAEVIQAEIAAVTQDMSSQEATEKIGVLVAGGTDVETATNNVIAEYTAAETERITNEHIAVATAMLTTDEHKNEVLQQVLLEKQEEYVQTASAEIITDEHKAEVVNMVLAEKQETFTEAATAEIVTEEQKTVIADTVVAELGEQYVNEAQLELADEIAAIQSQAETDISDVFTEVYVKPAYTAAANAVIDEYTAESSAIVTINPDNQASSVYTDNEEEVPAEYIDALIPYLQADVQAVGQGQEGRSLLSYIESSERNDFRIDRAYHSTAMLVASSMTSDDTVDELMDALAEFNVTRNQYDEMGFTYAKVHKIAYEAALDYQNKLTYEISLIQAEEGTEAYDTEVAAVKASLNTAVTGSSLEKLPEDVASGIEELGKMDLYGLIVGSIFFKMAGLLLPIIYLIMASNNLIAGQVDTGSMAYVLSTSTKRRQVTFTQGLYLVGSLLLMFICTAITSIVCFDIANVQTNLTIEKLIQINLGAFVVLFAMSGINFLTSCWFDRSKKAMALGGGVSMFFLVATMLGLFGSPVIPSVVRISTLNNFNYVSIISLFDVVSILDCTNEWLWKLGILVAIGLIGYIAGDIKFRKKDLPL